MIYYPTKDGLIYGIRDKRNERNHRELQLFYSKLGDWNKASSGATSSTAVDDGNGIEFYFKGSDKRFHLNYGDAGDMILLLRELNRKTPKIITAKRVEVKAK